MLAPRIVQRLLAVVLLSLASASFLGCGPLYPVLGALLGADAAQSSSGEEPAPVASVDSALARVTLSSAESVRIPFRLQQPSGLAARVEISWAPADQAQGPDAFRRASADPLAPAAEQTLQNLAASPAGQPHAFRWDAGADLAAYAVEVGLPATALRVVVRIRTFLGNRAGAPLLLPAFEAGNDRPVLSGATLPPEAELSGNVVVRFEVSDTSADPVSVELSYSTDGGQSYQVAARATGVADDLSSQRPPGADPHDFVWDSRGDLGRVRVEDVRLRLRLRDRFTTFDGATATNGAAAFLGPVTVANNGLPIVLLTEPALQLDRTNEVPLRVTVIDQESNPTDLAIQWTPVGEPFVPIDGLATPAPADSGGPLSQSAVTDAARFEPVPGADLRDPSVRRAALRDPDARRRLRLISLAPSRLEDRVGLDPARRQVRLGALARLGAPPRQIGRRVRFLDGVCAGEIRRITAYDPARAMATLGRDLPAVPAVGDRLEVERSEGVEGLASSPAGVEHDLVWDTLRDLAALDREVKLRLVAFDAEAGAAYASQPFFVRNAPLRETTQITTPTFHVEVGDLDGDGRDDLLLAGGDPAEGAPPLTVLTGQPDGSFVATPVPVLPLAGGNGVVVGRVFTLGPLRLLGAVSAAAGPDQDGRVQVLRFVPGSVTPAPPLLELTVPGLLDARIGELNGDGLPDLVLARMVTSTPSGVPGVAVDVALGEPGASLLAPVTVATATSTFLAGLRVVDLDGDGLTEILALAGSRGFVPGVPGNVTEVLLVRGGPGGFSATSTRLPPDLISQELFAQPLALGRLGAGDPHVFVGSGTLLYELALAPAGGGLRTIRRIELASGFSPGGGSLVAGFALGDLNGDGDSDLVVRRVTFDSSGTQRTTVELLRVETGGALTRLVSLEAPGGTFGFGGQVFVGDFDGDGGLDLASTELLSPLVTWAGASSFTLDDALLGAVAATGVGAFDRDGDGRPDAAATSAATVFGSSPTEETTLFDQTAAGALEPVGQLLFEGVPRGGDLLGADGVPELLIGASGILDAEQQLVADLETASGRALQDVLALVDWDGDGLLDVAALTPTGQTIVLRQNPAGGFASARIVEVTADPAGGPSGPLLLAKAAAGADLDADGRGDLVLALQTSELAVAFSGGDAVAARWGPAPVGANGQELAVADLDGDGRLDLAFPTFVRPGESVPVVRVLRATGPRAFEEMLSLPLTQASAGFASAAADATGDGLADLAVLDFLEFDTIGQTTTALTLHAQRPTGGFAASVAGPAETAPQGASLLRIALRDLTGDGRPDLAYPSRSGGVLRSIARGGSPDLVVAGRLASATALGRAVVTFVPGPAGPIEVDRRRLYADGTFRAHVPGSRLAAILQPPADLGLALGSVPPPPTPRPAELPLLIAVVPAGAPATSPLPPDTMAHVLVADRTALDERRVAGVTLSPLSTIAAIAALGGGLDGGLEAGRVRAGAALGRALVAGGAIDLGGGRLIATTTAQAAGLAPDDPAVLRAELEAALEAVAAGRSTSTLALARTIGLALGDPGNPVNPVAVELAEALRDRDASGMFAAAADGIEAGVAPAPPPAFTLAPERAPSAGGARVTATAIGGGSFAAGARVRVVGLGLQATVSSTSTTVTFVTPAGAAGPYAVRVEQQGLETEGPPLTLFQGTREAVIEPLRLAFPPTFLGSASGSVRTVTIRNPSSASEPLRAVGLALRAVALPDLGFRAPALQRVPFSVVRPLGPLPPVEPGASLALDVRFRPTEEVRDSQRLLHLFVLELETDDPDQPRRSVLLDAMDKGLVPLEVSDLCFGFVPAGTTATGTVTLTNLAPEPLTVSVSLPPGSGFSIAAPPQVTVQGSGTLDLMVTYAPAMPGVSTAAIDIQGVSTPAGPVTFDLSASLGGAATGQRLVVLPDPEGAPLDLGLQEPGTPPLPLRIRLRNGGGKDPADPAGADLQVTAISLVGAGFTLVSGDAPVVLTAATLTLPCGTPGGGGGGGPVGSPIVVPVPGPSAAPGRVHDLVLVYEPDPLASGLESRLDTATLTISTVELGDVSVALWGHAATGELVRAGGPTSSPAFPALGSPSSTAVRVRVYGALTGAPLPGAQVALVDPAAPGAPPVVLVTGADGRVVTGTTATALEVHVGRTGYLRRSFFGTAAGDLAVLLLPAGTYRGSLAADRDLPPVGPGDPPSPFAAVSSDAVAQLRNASGERVGGGILVFGGTAARFDALLASPTRLAVTDFGSGFTSGFGPRPGAAGGELVLGTVPLSAGGGGAASTEVTGLLLDGRTGLRVPPDTPYAAFATIEPPEPIAPLTGAALGRAGDSTHAPAPFDVSLLVEAYSPATLADLGGRLRLHASILESRQIASDIIASGISVSTFREARIRLPAATTTFPATATWTLPVAAQVGTATAVSNGIEVTFDDVLAVASSSTPGIYRLDVLMGGGTVVWTAFLPPLAVAPGGPPPARTVTLSFDVLPDDVSALLPAVVSVALTTFYVDLQDPDDPALPPGAFDLERLTGFTMHDLQRRVVGRTTDGPVGVSGGGGGPPGGP